MMRRIRALPSAVWIAAALVAFAARVGGCGSGAAGSTVAARGVAGRYNDPAGWSIVYPSTMRVERSNSGPGLATFSEVTIANFIQQTAVHSGPTSGGFQVDVRPPLDAHGRFPRDGVALRILLEEGGPPPIVTVPDARFPIELSAFKAPEFADFPTADYAKRGVPASLDLQIEANGRRYSAIALIGSRASPHQRAALARVIRSLSFPPLHPGTEVNDLWPLQPADRYPVESFTLIHAPGAICNGNASDCHRGNAPFYLVHAPGRLHGPDLIEPCPQLGVCTPPGAFYAIGWTSQMSQGGYTSSCDLRLDRHDDQFYCTNINARWDRVGRVIERPPRARSNDPLQFAFAKVAWDRHVVIAPGVGGNPPRGPALRRLWPNWHPAR